MTKRIVQIAEDYDGATLLLTSDGRIFERARGVAGATRWKEIENYPPSYDPNEQDEPSDHADSMRVPG